MRRDSCSGPKTGPLSAALGGLTGLLAAAAVALLAGGYGTVRRLTV